MNRTAVLPGPSEIHLWTVWLTAPNSVSQQFREFLSPEELGRADKFHLERPKRSFVLARGALRLILAYYLGCAVSDLVFRFGPNGKPALQSGSRLRFNTSHSADLALYAFLIDCEIGVDIEKVRPIMDIERIASSFFCLEEVSELLSIKETAGRQEAFFRCWTRKEAFIKATGNGLSQPLNQFQVSLLSNDPVRFAHISMGAQTADKWTLQHLEPARRYIGALAHPGPPRRITYRRALKASQLLDEK